VSVSESRAKCPHCGGQIARVRVEKAWGLAEAATLSQLVYSCEHCDGFLGCEGDPNVVAQWVVGKLVNE
jgi:phage terminase large subunit GpA-like protein